MGRRDRVLLIEREAATREVLAIVLRTLGYEVTAAGELSGVARAIETFPPALVIIDFLRPASEIRPLLSVFRVGAERTEAGPAILALIDPHETHDPEERALLHGLVDATLNRPVEPQRLARAVRTLLAGQAGT